MNYARSSAPALPDFFFNILVTVGIVLNALGLFSLIMEPDGALYATIAKTVAESGDFVNLIVEDRDWLDKPHFPFWVAAISYKIFGINSFAYKFPAFLFFLGSVWYTYQFALLAYSRLVAQISTLVMLTALHLVISNNDVRAEPYLTAQVIGAVFHFFRLYRSDRPLDLVLGALWTGMALMTKGPFVVVPIGAGLFIHIVLTGQWREFLQLRWYLAIVLSLLFCLPELYTLYLQFDLHPEKVVFGKTGNSGIRFFFWDSQFGRFFNTGPIKGSGEKTFFLHTTLWAFAPWALLLYAAVGRAVLRLIGRIPYLPEYVSLGSGLMTFLLFSLSGFQLPHYLNIVFPFYAVLTAHFLTTLRNNVTHRRWLRTIQIQYLLLLVIVGGLIWYFRPQPMAGAIIWAVLVTVVTAVLARGRWLTALVGWAVGSSVLALGFYNLFLYPQLMPYQAGGEAAFYINEHNTPEQPGGMRLAGMYVEDQYSFEFYLKQRAYYWRTKADLKAVADKEPVWILTSPTHLDTLRQDGWRVAPIDTFNFFHVTKLTGEFLNHRTRAQTLKPKVLAEVRSRP